MNAVHDVIVIGAGPAGLTAGLYLARAGLRTLIIERGLIGGELVNRDLIENYPSYPDGILGPELASKIAQQAMNCGVEIQLGEVKLIQIDGNHKIVKTSNEDHLAEAIIVASGAHPKKLGIPGEQEFTDRGVFYCATCDGPHFRDKVVAVVGGGDSGVTDALLLTRLVSKVILLARHFTATKILKERVLSNPKVEVKYGLMVEAIRGTKQVETIDVVNINTGHREVLKVDGVLVHAGLEPSTDFLTGSLGLTEKRQLMVNEKMETATAGIFAVGDVRHNSPMQVATAVGDGATAALGIQRHLNQATQKSVFKSSQFYSSPFGGL